MKTTTRRRSSSGSSNNLPSVVRFAKELLELDRAQKTDAFKIDENAVARTYDFSASPTRGLKSDIAIRQASDEDDPFDQGLYTEQMLVPPLWNPWTLRHIFEESDILQSCIRAYVDALARPYELDYCGPKQDHETTEVVAEERKCRDFLSQVNEKNSWFTLTRKKELDYWWSGNAYIECLEDREIHEPLFLYTCPPTYMRVTQLDNDPQLTWIMLPRNGQLRLVPVYRRFRRFARWLPTKQIEWFKELGDPRVINKTTGKYITDNRGNYLLEKDLKPEDYGGERGNSIWWFRDTIGGMVYGVPRWVSAMADIRGLYLSRWVNFDTLDHGGIPPWLLLVYGKLAPGTRKYLKEVIKKWRDPKAFSDPGVLEIEPNLLSFNSSGGAKAGAEFVSMRDMRNEDGMFNNYCKTARQNIGAVMRLPGILYGEHLGTGDSGWAAIETTETSVFAPLRAANDEKYNVELLQQQMGVFRWKIKTKNPPLNGESFYKALGMAGRTGGPSLNQLTRMCNEMFGTNWPEREHWFYREISAAEAVGMVRAGQVTYDNESGEPIILPPQQPQQAPPDGQKFAYDDGEHGKSPGDIGDELKKLLPEADAINILTAFQRLEKEVANYEPTDNPDPEFRM